MTYRDLSRKLALTTILLLGVGFSGASLAGTYYVDVFGQDGQDCGSSQAPCRSIGRAVLNATPGSRIVVGPGRYDNNSEPAPFDCLPSHDCLILIDKRVRIESSAGPAATFIDARPRDVTVVVAADDVEFGRGANGFTLLGARDQGLHVREGTEGVRISGNVATDISGGVGFAVHGDEHEVWGNLSMENSFGFIVTGSDHRITENRSLFDATGFSINGTWSEVEQNRAEHSIKYGFWVDGFGHQLEKNLATYGDLEGFRVTGESILFERNVAMHNDSVGFLIETTRDVTLDRCSAINNGGAGIASDSYNVLVTRSNIYGNDADGQNCGIDTITGPLVAQDNFWGSPTGPGASEPADDVCGNVVFGPSAWRPNRQPTDWLPMD